MPVAFPFFNLPSTVFTLTGLICLNLNLSLPTRIFRIGLSWFGWIWSVNLFPTDAKYWLQASVMSCFHLKFDN